MPDQIKESAAAKDSTEKPIYDPMDGNAFNGMIVALTCEVVLTAIVALGIWAAHTKWPWQ
jgi:hypothetical protein